MALIPLRYNPGICKVDSPYAAKNRYTDMNLMRFVAGFPEKLGGSTTITGNIFADHMITSLRDWRDNSGNVYLGIGSITRLWQLPAGLNASSIGTETDITPLRYITTSTLTNPLTTNTTTTVSVSHTSHGLSTGDYVRLVSTVAIDNIILGNSYYVTVTNANAYTITVPTAATGSTSGGGGTVTYSYPRAILGSNPFSTTLGSNLVTVTHSSHGASAGDYAYWSGGVNFAGLTFTTGSFEIVSIVNANSYQITFPFGTNANATTSGGGSTVSIEYGITFSPATTKYVNAGQWTLSPYGQQLLANPPGASIYVYDPSIGGRAYPLYNAPTNVLATFVTAERFVFALGTSLPMQVQWADQTDYTQWTATVSNTANSRTLQEGSYLVGGISVRDGISLVLSNTGCYQFNYIGDNNVYADTLAGVNTGLISPTAICVMGGSAYWFSGKEFYTWNGSVQPLPSDDIRDYVIKNFTIGVGCWASANSAKKEIWFGDVTGNYVIYHTDQNIWSIGNLGVFSYLDKHLFGYPIAATNSILYYMDNGTDLSSVVTDNPYITFSPTDISNGDNSMDIFSFIPDFQRQIGNCQLTINLQKYPNDPVVVGGTYVLGTNSQRADFRINAKLIGGKIESNAFASDFRLGLPRVEAQLSGARR